LPGWSKRGMPYRTSPRLVGVARLEGAAFCLDRQVADNVDALYHTASGRSAGWMGAGSVVEPVR
jgi:hypothetical protein